MQMCVSCGAAKELQEFGLTGGASGRRRKKCNCCRKKEKLAAYYAKSLEVNAKRKELYLANPGKFKVAARESKARRKEQVRRYRKAYAKANSLKTRQWCNKRRARINAAIGSFTEADLQRQLKRQCGLCYYCGCPHGSRFQLDHVLPVSRGGGNYPENIVVACQPCNSSKWCKFVAEWKHDRFFKSSLAKHRRIDARPRKREKA